jgi:hypothetical protein
VLEKILIAGTIVLGVVLAVVLTTQPLTDEEARHQAALHQLDEQRAAWELQQSIAQDERLQGFNDARNAAGDVLLFAFGLLTPAVAVLAVAFGWHRYWHNRGVVWPRADGTLPVPYWQLPNAGPAALAGFHQAAIARATAPGRAVARDVTPVAAPVVKVVAPAPTFGSLLENGTIGPGHPLILGYADGQPLGGTWSDLYSSAVAGISGSGKTTTLRFLAGQSALQGARFVVLDPHALAGADSLAGTLAPLHLRFWAPPESKPAAMLELLEAVADVLAARLAGGPVDYPLIVCVDEFTSLMGRSEVAAPLATLIEAIAQEGRKALVFALISGQVWTADRAGSTALRDALASTYVHRMRPDQARRLLPNADAKRAEGLSPGRALLARTTGEVIEVSIPMTTQADIERVATLVATQAATEMAARGRSTSSQIVDVVAITKPEVAKVAVSDEARRAADLFFGGMSMADVVKELRGVTSSQGGRYQTALADVQELVRQGVKGGA